MVLCLPACLPVLGLIHRVQVHVANLYGEDKVSFDDRVAFVEKHMDKVSMHVTAELMVTVIPAYVHYRSFSLVVGRVGKLSLPRCRSICIGQNDNPGERWEVREESKMTPEYTRRRIKFLALFLLARPPSKVVPCPSCLDGGGLDDDGNNDRSEIAPCGRWRASAGGRTRTAPGSASPCVPTSRLRWTAQTPLGISRDCPCTRTVRRDTVEGAR